jgi:hypothetical protein
MVNVKGKKVSVYKLSIKDDFANNFDLQKPQHYQKLVKTFDVTKTFIEALKSRLDHNPDPESLFNFCLPLRVAIPPVHVQKVSSKRYVFQCPSSDFQFQETLLINPEQLAGCENYGITTNAVGLLVGLGSNFLNVLQDDDSKRLLLHNGYHRACALRSLGITHAPCIIQTVTRRDELDIVAHSTVAQSPGCYFNAPRPPLLKDFFDPKICKVLPTKKLLKTVEINFDIKEYWVFQ